MLRKGEAFALPFSSSYVIDIALFQYFIIYTILYSRFITVLKTPLPVQGQKTNSPA